jgi:hypothetical protein
MPILISFITLFPSIRVRHLRFIVRSKGAAGRGSQKMAEDGAMSETEDFPEFDLGALGIK